MVPQASDAVHSAAEQTRATFQKLLHSKESAALPTLEPEKATGKAGSLKPKIQAVTTPPPSPVAETVANAKSQVCLALHQAGQFDRDPRQLYAFLHLCW